MRNKYLTIVLLFCIHSYSQEGTNINEAPPSAFQYQGVTEVNLHKTDVEVPTYKRDDLTKTDEAKPLTEDYFSNLGSEQKKKSFESYSTEKEKVILKVKKLNHQQTATEPPQGLNDGTSTNIFNYANTIITFLGLTVFGFFIRGFFNNKTVSSKPTNIYSWIIQLVISITVGAFIWFLVIPKSFKGESENDPADIIILKSK